jgi:hypothetical protein
LIDETFLSNLITCEKKAVRADRKRMTLVNRNYRNDISVISLDNKYQYKMFLRYSDEFNEDFSVGLIWMNSEKFTDVSKPVLLIRYQGPHDSGQAFGVDVHNDYHIHQITIMDINEGRFIKPSNIGITNKFSSFGEAVMSFSQDCGIIELENCIDISQFYNEIPGQLGM